LQGAQILEERISFRRKEFEHCKRIRILNRAGRTSLELDSYDLKAGSLEARVIQPDGKETTYDPARDALLKKVVIGGTTLEYRTPTLPGLSDNCIVDIRWKEPLVNELQVMPARYGLSHEWRLANPFPTTTIQIEFPKSALASHRVISTEGNRAEVSSEEGTLRYTFRNIPAHKPVPFALRAQAPVPRLQIWYPRPGIFAPTELGKEILDWKKLGQTYLKYYEQGANRRPVKAGDAFSAMAEAALKSAPAGTHAKAAHILDFLESSILNTSTPTHEERARRTKSVEEESVDPADLDQAVQRGRTNAAGMAYLYYHLLKRAGIQPLLLLVTSRHSRLFDPYRPDGYQLDTVVMAIQSEEGGMLWVHPARRYFPAGVLDADFQGTRGLLINPTNGSTQVVQVPVQGSMTNRAAYRYSLGVGGEGVKFSFQAGFTGLPEYRLRSTCMRLQGPEQAAYLKEELEGVARGQGLVISSAGVENATSPKLNLLWTASGSMEIDEGRRRTFDPFPALPMPISAPDEWPDTRTQPIVLPYCMAFGASSRIELPEGVTLRAEDPIQESNSVGQVRWALSKVGGGNGRTWEVAFTVTISKAILAESEYDATRAFLKWVTEGRARKLVLEKP
jgi:hypothetical protein